MKSAFGYVKLNGDKLFSFRCQPEQKQKAKKLLCQNKINRFDREKKVVPKATTADNARSF